MSLAHYDDWKFWIDWNSWRHSPDWTTGTARSDERMEQYHSL